jgi:adenylate cyclase
MVWGQVLQRFGDVFGSRVNLAARLTDLADASTVFVDPSTAALLAGQDKYHLAVMPERQIQGLGLMRPVRVSQPG